MSFLLFTCVPIATGTTTATKTRQRITTQRTVVSRQARSNAYELAKDRDLHLLVNPFAPTGVPTSSTKAPTASTKAPSPTRAPNVIGGVQTSSASQMNGAGVWFSTVLLAVGAGAFLSFGI